MSAIEKLALFLFIFRFAILFCFFLFSIFILHPESININSLDCTGEKSWEHGSSLINYMKLTTFNGLSGMIQFDSQGKVFQNTSKKLEVGIIKLVSRLIHSSEVQLVYLNRLFCELFW